MSWIKTKRIFDKESQLPTVEDRNDCLRIFYSFRIGLESNINYFEIRKKDFKIIYENKQPVLTSGSRGCFDDCGVMPSCIINNQLFYTGWTTKQKTPYSHAIGLATFDDKKNKFIRINDGPILSVNENIPYLANSAFVINNKMWFCNGTGWIDNNPTYQICLAELINDNWIVNKNFNPVGLKNEINSRPFVRNNNIYFSKKSINNKYQIFKDNEKIIAPSDEGWDNEMVCYPYLFEKYMFYNGNGYGKTGIGVAECI